MKIKNKKILITGGTGFIGSHLANKLATQNKVWITGRKKPVVYSGNFLKADIRDNKFINYIKNSKFDYIFHLAGNAVLETAFQSPVLDFEINAFATLRILEALRFLKHRPKFIFASSVAVYGACRDKKLTEDISVTIPISNYGVAKLAAERYVFTFAKQYGLPAVTFRIFPTYGPGLKRQIVYDFIKKLDKNQTKLEILGDGTQARDLVFIEDLVENMIKVSHKAKYKGEVYNLCSGKLYSTKRIAYCVARAMGLRPEFVFTGKIRIFDGQSWLGNNSKIKKLGCKTTTSLQKGIAETVCWYNSGSEDFLNFV